MTDVDRSSAAAGNRRTLLLMIGILVSIILGATTLYQLAEHGAIDLPAVLGTGNRGMLVQPPMAMSDLEVRARDGDLQRYADLPRKWTLLIPAAHGCDDSCRSSLHETRQVRIALGREMPRLRRILLTGSATQPAFRAWLEREHEDLLVLQTSPAAVGGLPPREMAGSEAGYFIVDPEGWLMMAYRERQDPKDLLKDLKFLLRNSGAE